MPATYSTGTWPKLSNCTEQASTQTHVSGAYKFTSALTHLPRISGKCFNAWWQTRRGTHRPDSGLLFIDAAFMRCFVWQDNMMLVSNFLRDAMRMVRAASSGDELDV